MRKLISYPAEPLLAQKLHAWLAVNQIDARCKQVDDEWEIWVLDEDQLLAAQELASTFNANPDDPQFATVLNKANKIEAEKDKLQRVRRKEATNTHPFYNVRSFRLQSVHDCGTDESLERTSPITHTVAATQGNSRAPLVSHQRIG